MGLYRIQAQGVGWDYTGYTAMGLHVRIGQRIFHRLFKTFIRLLSLSEVLVYPEQFMFSNTFKIAFKVFLNSL